MTVILKFHEFRIKVKLRRDEQEVTTKKKQITLL